MNWGIFIHNPDGDMGEGIIIGPISSKNDQAGTTNRLTEKITETLTVECIIVPIVSSKNIEAVFSHFEEL